MLLFAFIVGQISCFFKNRSNNLFFEVPSADLSSKASFLEPFWAPMGSQVEPQGGTLGPNGSQCSTPEVYRKHPGADYLQTMSLIRDFGLIWVNFVGFGIHSGAFGGPFWILLAMF